MKLQRPPPGALEAGVGEGSGGGVDGERVDCKEKMSVGREDGWRKMERKAR